MAECFRHQNAAGGSISADLGGIRDQLHHAGILLVGSVFRDWRWAAVVEALTKLKTHLNENLVALACFNAFCDTLHAEFMSDINHAADNGFVLLILCDIINKRAIDLDNIQRKFSQQ